MKPFNQNAVIRGAIRRTFARSPVVREVMNEVRKEFPKYNKDGSRSKKDAVCYLCNRCKKYVGSTKISVDHKIPVVSVEEGFVDWNEFISRLYCGKENLQVICDDCHKRKTNFERFLRQFYKESKIIMNMVHRLTFDQDLTPTEDELKLLKTFNPKKLKQWSEYDAFTTGTVVFLKKYLKDK